MKKHFLTLAGTFLMAQAGLAQLAPGSMPAPMSAAGLHKHLSVLASDDYEGRETGKKGSLMAADYISKHFAAIGLIPVGDSAYYQPVPLVEKMPATGTMRIGSRSFDLGSDFMTLNMGAAPTVFNLTEKSVVFVGYGGQERVEDDLTGIDLKDKVVLILNAAAKNKQENANKLLQTIHAKQPKLLLMVYPEMTRNLMSRGKKGQIGFSDLSIERESVSSLMYVSEALANALLKPTLKTVAAWSTALQKGQKTESVVIKQSFELNYQLGENPLRAMNVMGLLPGTDLEDEVLVISAHYDHIGIIDGKINNGADDDGSGTSAILALAETFAQQKKDGKGPRRSILFLAFTGEEKGLLGSEWYSKHPKIPFAQTIADLNIDMIGRIDREHTLDTNYVYLIGSDKLSTDLHRISEEANRKSVNLKLDYKFNDPNDPNKFYYRSDHYNFAKHGVPVIFYFNGVHADYHQPTDTIEKIHFELMAKRTQLVFATAAALADVDKRPAVDVENDFR